MNTNGRLPRPGTISPSALFELSWAPMRFQVLKSAVELGIFDAIHGGAQTPREVAKAIRANERATRMLLDELAALDLLRKSSERYRLTPVAALFLLKGGPCHVRDWIAHTEMLQESWRNLVSVVRRGEPVRMVDTPAQGQEFFKMLVKMIFPMSYASACALLREVKLPTRGEARILDVAAGSAAWSLPFAENYANVRVTAADFPPVLEVARDYARRHGVLDRYEFLEGNIRETDFGRERYDLVILGHICHSEGAEWSRRLIAKSARALKPGGRIVIPDMVPNDRRTGPEFPLLFAINMLLHTTDGDTFTLAEYRRWLNAAGLNRAAFVNSSALGCHVVTATKPARSKAASSAKA